MILFESPHRLKKFLNMAREEFGPALTAIVAREISKIYEEWTGGAIDDTIAKIEAAGDVKGEVVVLLRPPEKGEEEEEDEKETDFHHRVERSDTIQKKQDTERDEGEEQGLS